MMNGNGIPLLRTVCGCGDCVRHCHERPGFLEPDDLPAIAAHLGITVRELVAQHLEAGLGMLLARISDDGRECEAYMGLPTIRPRSEAGRCHWLTTDDGCVVHAVAPFGCRYFDEHMPADEADRRARIGAERIYAGLLNDPEFRGIVALLGCVVPGGSE